MPLATKTFDDHPTLFPRLWLIVTVVVTGARIILAVAVVVFVLITTAAVLVNWAILIPPHGCQRVPWQREMAVEAQVEDRLYRHSLKLDVSAPNPTF